jgi:iron(III) transport system permease protein
LPLVGPSFLYGWLVVAVIISGELSVPLVLYSPGNEVISVAVYNLQQSRREGVAAAVFALMLLVAMATLLVIRVAAQVYAAYRQRQRQPGPHVARITHTTRTITQRP